jgi:outer membrane receptor protein involved in Fe transport
LFASDNLALNPQTHLTISGRYNRTTVKNRDGITPGGGPGSLDGDHTFGRFNPAIGVTFAAIKSLTAYAGVNQGSRAPSAIELGCADPANPCKLPNAMAGDPPLKQVVTTTVETGLRGNARGTNWNVGIFRSDNMDDIMFVAGNQSGFGYFKNFGKTRRQGIEAGLSTRVGEVALGANYTYIDATYRSDEVVNGGSNSSNQAAADGFPGVDSNIFVRAGKRIPLIPQHLLKLFADLTMSPAWAVGANVTGVGGSFARRNENNAHQSDGTYYLGPGRTGGYAVLNLSADWRPATGLTVFLQINNVFDRKYSTASQLGATGFDASGNFVARPFLVDANGDRPLVHSTFYAPGAPRSFFVGLRYIFGE